MYSVQGIFQHHFQCKKVHTRLDEILYTDIEREREREQTCTARALHAIYYTYTGLALAKGPKL
jgi:hypothetical protein